MGASRKPWVWRGVIVAVIIVAAVAVGVLALQASAADRHRDAEARSGLVTIRHAVFAWANAHEKNVPPADSLTPAKLIAYLPAGATWPDNPFTGEPMRAGTGPGDVRYRPANPHVFTIDSVGTDGKSVW